jgi:hypothetical protein
MAQFGQLIGGQLEAWVITIKPDAMAHTHGQDRQLKVWFGLGYPQRTSRVDAQVAQHWPVQWHSMAAGPQWWVLADHSTGVLDGLTMPSVVDDQLERQRHSSLDAPRPRINAPMRTVTLHSPGNGILACSQPATSIAVSRSGMSSQLHPEAAIGGSSVDAAPAGRCVEGGYCAEG